MIATLTEGQLQRVLPRAPLRARVMAIWDRHFGHLFSAERRIGGYTLLIDRSSDMMKVGATIAQARAIADREEEKRRRRLAWRDARRNRHREVLYGVRR